MHDNMIMGNGNLNSTIQSQGYFPSCYRYWQSWRGGGGLVGPSGVTSYDNMWCGGGGGGADCDVLTPEKLPYFYSGLPVPPCCERVQGIPSRHSWFHSAGTRTRHQWHAKWWWTACNWNQTEHQSQLVKQNGRIKTGEQGLKKGKDGIKVQKLLWRNKCGEKGRKE